MAEIILKAAIVMVDDVAVSVGKEIFQVIYPFRRSGALLAGFRLLIVVSS